MMQFLVSAFKSEKQGLHFSWRCEMVSTYNFQQRDGERCGLAGGDLFSKEKNH